MTPIRWNDAKDALPRANPSRGGRDSLRLKARAAREGLPRQTLIDAILHKVARQELG